MAVNRNDLLLTTLESIQDAQQAILVRQDAHHNTLLERLDRFENEYGPRVRKLERDMTVIRVSTSAVAALLAWFAANWASVKGWFQS